MTSLMTRLFGRPVTRSPRPARRRAPLGVESLDGRVLLSAMPATPAALAPIGPAHVQVQAAVPAAASPPLVAGHWQNLGGYARSEVTASNADGRLEIFYIGGDNALWHRTQVAPGGAFAPDQRLGGYARQLAVGKNADGRLEVFYIGGDNALWHLWQTAPSGNWSGHASFGGYAKQLAVANDADGRLEAFYVGGDNAVWHLFERGLNGDWSGHSRIGGYARQIAVGANPDGRLELVYVGGDNGIWHRWQTAPNGGWSGEAGFGGYASSIAVGRDADGRVEIFYVGGDHALWHLDELPGNKGWTGHARLGGYVRQMSVGDHPDGRIEVFTVGGDYGVYHFWQTAPNGGWSGESRLGVPTRAQQLAVSSDTDGRLELVAIGPDGALNAAEQTAPNGSGPWTCESHAPVWELAAVAVDPDRHNGPVPGTDTTLTFSRDRGVILEAYPDGVQTRTTIDFAPLPGLVTPGKPFTSTIHVSGTSTGWRTPGGRGTYWVGGPIYDGDCRSYVDGRWVVGTSDLSDSHDGRGIIVQQTITAQSVRANAPDQTYVVLEVMRLQGTVGAYTYRLV